MRSLARVSFACGLLVSLALGQVPEGTLFDGHSLAGWDGDPAVWSVRDGCIVGSTVGHAIEHNTFLVGTGAPLADFELTFDVRLEGDNNSGVQYRSERLDGFAVAGYQCDVHAEPSYFGMLYEERGAGIAARRGQRVARDAQGTLRVLANGAAPPAVDLAQWHTLRIRARGRTVEHFVGDQRTIEFTDDLATARRSGCIALQVHAGPPMTVWFRNFVLRRLAPEEVAQIAPGGNDAPAAAAAGEPVPQWIWDAAPQNGEEVFFRRVFALPAAPRSAVLAVTCDNHCRVYVNGERVAQSDRWEAPRVLDVARHLRQGDNVIAVHGWNDAGPAALCALLRWRAVGDAAGVLATDGSWQCGADDPDGWDAVAGTAATAAWPAATVLAPLGGGPWAGTLGSDAFADVADVDAPQPPQPAPELTVAAGGVAERLLAVPRAFGSWVCLARDDRGRLYASDQTRGLYRILPAGRDGRTDTQIERIDVDIDGCQGLCWARGGLYAVANGAHTGLYRLDDTDGDDRLDSARLLRALDGSGEHGAHAVVVAPDGEHLLVLCGNHTRVPELARSRVPRNWREDALLPRLDDPNGHAVGITAPGGFVCQVDFEGKEWELVCCGFRNAYDLAVVGGEVVTYDADMEWDMGLPWYRPTRILQVLSGVDYGWRSGSTKWPVDYPDTLPGILDVGPGSPTGVAAIGSPNARLLAADWTFGLLHGTWLYPQGGGLHAGGGLEPVASGMPLPISDVVVEPNPREGASIYVLTGGRGLPSSLYRLQEPTDGFAWADGEPDRRRERARLEAFHGRVDAAAIATLWPYLDDEDPVLRHAARIALESQPVAQWRRDAVATAGDAHGSDRARLTVLLALARQGEPADLPAVARALSSLPFAELEPKARIAWLRVLGLALLRLGPPDAELVRGLGAQLLERFPTGDSRVDGELAAVLAHLEVEGLVAKALPLLADMRPAAPPPWAERAARNKSYGGAIEKMLGAMPPTAQLALANALRTVHTPWTTAQRRQFFAFVQAARQQKGGASYDGYLRAMQGAVWAGCSPEERVELASVAGMDDAGTADAAHPAPAAFQATPPKGPARSWQLADAVAVARRGLAAGAPPRDLAAGRNLFHAVNCASCHRFGGEGGGTGPDLTSLANKFRPQDVLESILEPSRVVSDQFAGAVLTRKDGTTVFGRVSKKQDGADASYEVVTATKDAAVVRVAAADVDRIEPAKMSPMPAGLVDPLGEDELLDLLAYLLSRGEGGSAR